jgi:hypothetical protein
VTTTQVLIVMLALVAIAAFAALTRYGVRRAELESEDRRVIQQAHDREVARAVADAARADASAGRGPADGTRMGVHVGPHLIQGARVLRDAPEAEGWVVLEGAELLEGTRATPLGGRQWLRAAQWMQELP